MASAELWACGEFAIALAHERSVRSNRVRVQLRIRTLGATFVESARGPIDGPWLDQRTGQLLKYLVCERHRTVSIDEIGESIWPGAQYGVAASVRYYVHALRRILEPDRPARAPSAFILSSAGGYRLNHERVQVDADEFETTLATGRSLLRSDYHTGRECIERALTLYGGDFLADVPYAEWALSERHRLHELACMGLRTLADEGPDAAVASLARLATMQPYDEDVHRRLIERQIAGGRRSDAIRNYEALSTRMRNAFGQEPAFTPAELVTTAN